MGWHGGWIRVWFKTIDEQVEVAKAQLKGYKNNDVGIGLKTKDFETWGNTFIYWQYHGIPMKLGQRTKRNMIYISTLVILIIKR